MTPAFRGTPFHPRTSALNQHHLWFDWDGRLVVDVYDDVFKELSAIRHGVAMCEMSPLSKYEVRGPDAARFIDSLTTRDVKQHAVGGVRYSPVCNESGRVVTEALIFRLTESSFRMSADPAEMWLRSHAGDLNIEIEDVTERYGILSIQGPRSVAVMEQLTGTAWSDVSFSQIRNAVIGGVEMMVARQGFTGELGFELWPPAKAGPRVWDAVAAAGERFDIRPAGEHAIEIARIESGMLIMGADYAKAGPDRLGTQTATSPGDEGTPFELGMERFVDLDKSEFVGQAALAAQAANGSLRRRLIGLVLDHAVLTRAGREVGGAPSAIPARVSYYPMAVRHEGRIVGRATSITWAPSIQEVVAFGHLEPPLAQLAVTVEVDWSHGGVELSVPATVVQLPFLDLRRN